MTFPSHSLLEVYALVESDNKNEYVSAPGVPQFIQKVTVNYGAWELGIGSFMQACHRDSNLQLEGRVEG